MGGMRGLFDYIERTWLPTPIQGETIKNQSDTQNEHPGLADCGFLHGVAKAWLRLTGGPFLKGLDLALFWF